MKRGVLAAFVSILFGILFILGGANFANYLLQIAVIGMGLFLIVLGILSIINRNLFFGIVLIILGILADSFAWNLVWVALIMFSVALVVYGLDDLFHKRGLVICNILDIIAGILVFMMALGNEFAWNFANIFFYVGGGLMVLNGILMLIPVKR